MKKNKTHAQEVSISKNQFVMDDGLYEAIGEIVTRVLTKNHCDWMDPEEIRELQHTTAMHVWSKSAGYDPDKGSPMQFVWTYAHNYVVTKSIELWNEHKKHVSLDQLDIFGSSNDEEDDNSPRRKKFSCKNDSTFANAEDLISGLSSKEFAADYSFEREAEDNIKARRFSNLQAFLDSELTPTEKKMLEMLQAKLTKEDSSLKKFEINYVISLHDKEVVMTK